MAMAMPLRPFHLVAISLVILALLPPHASALAMGGARGTPSSATARLDAASSVARRQEEDHHATAPSPQAAPPPAPTTRPAHRARVRYTHYGATLADLRSVCQQHPLCFADSDHSLLSVLYGPHLGGSWDEDDDRVYGIVRTIEGTQPILPSAWRAYVYSGGDVCHVEIGYMAVPSFLDIACPAWTCERHFTRSADEALAWAISAIATPCGSRGGITRFTTSSAAAIPSPPNAMALLPLLATAFLPPPMAAAMALSSLAWLAVATATGHTDQEYATLNHATCAVYAYDNATGTVDRARPVSGLRMAVCSRPLCFGGDLDERTLSVVRAERQGRRDDPLRVYCSVHSLEGAAAPSIFFPWRNTWRAHLPIADPAGTTAAAGDGDHLCYVELAHMDYREGYYVRCPVAGGHAHVSCTEFPEEAVALAVWEHRRLTYRGTVGLKCELYKYAAAGQFLGYDYNAEL